LRRWATLVYVDPADKLRKLRVAERELTRFVVLVFFGVVRDYQAAQNRVARRGPLEIQAIVSPVVAPRC
ncbi:MAG TPA: hypothetical protein VKQ05_03020, partial [Gemmatimonadales bacterium]|nr:hypothetical protein [Gemmatimonadales bacterium]